MVNKKSIASCNGTTRNSRAAKGEGTKMKGSSNGSGTRSRSHQHNLREAERRLYAILKTAQSMSVSPSDLTDLSSVKKIADTTCYTRWTRHIWALLIALATVLVILLACSVEDHALGCLRNTSEAAVVPSAESVAPAQAPPSTTDTVQSHAGQGEEEDPVNSRHGGWVQSSQQLVRRER